MTALNNFHFVSGWRKRAMSETSKACYEYNQKNKEVFTKIRLLTSEEKKMIFEDNPNNLRNIEVWNMKEKTENTATRKVLLDTVDKAKEFVRHTSKFMRDAQLVSGRYIADAKSILGVMSLDLSKPITVNIHDDDIELADMLLKKFYVR